MERRIEMYTSEDLPWEDVRAGIADDEAYSVLLPSTRNRIVELADAHRRWTSVDIAAQLEREGAAVTSGVVERVLGDEAAAS